MGNAGIDRANNYWEDFFSYCCVPPFEAWLIGSKPWISEENVFFTNVGDIEANVSMDSFSFHIKVEVMSDHPFLVFCVSCIPNLSRPF